METRQPIFDSDFSEPKFPETKPDRVERDRVERILNMDEETFRRLFNIQKVEKVDQQEHYAGTPGNLQDHVIRCGSIRERGMERCLEGGWLEVSMHNGF